MSDPNYWYGKRVLITGGDGFVASHLANTLLAQGAVVVVTVRHLRPIRTMQLLSQTEAQPDIEQCDLSNFSHVQQICNRHQIDTIFHLAASAIVSDSARAPMSTIHNNVLSTLNLLEAARINEVPRVLVASSDKSYGDHADRDDPERLPYTETQALRGLDVYSSSKVCADMISQTYAFQFKLPVLVVRCCNIYGPGDLNFTRLIPRTIMRLLSDHAPVINRGNERVLREYIYIDDVVRSYMFLAEHLEHHYAANRPQRGRNTYGWAAYNVGSYTAFPAEITPDSHPNIRNVVDVIEMIGSILGKSIRPVHIEKAANFIEIPDQYLDSGKIMRHGFRTQVDLEEGLGRSVEWYRSNQEHLDKVASKYLTA